MINDVHVSPEYVWSAGQGLSLDVPATLEFTDPKELGVYVNGVPLAASNFTVQKKDGSDAYAVSFVTAPAVGDRIVIARACKFDQPVNLHNYQAYDREVVERMFDRLTQMCGELKERLGRAVLARIGISDADFEKWVAGVVEPNRLTVGAVSTGEDAAASISGEAPNLVLNLTLPKGDKGDQGVQGPQGEKGDQGDMGATGPQGPQGPQGLKGDKGDKGDDGPQGLQGAKGDTGAKGDPGPQGVQGAKGDKGDKGDPGDDGFSPMATVTQTATGATITVTDKNGTTTANVTNGKDGNYTLPAATAETLGGIKVGSRLSIDANGVLSADEQSSSYTLPVASTSTLGGVKVNNSTGALKVASDGLLALLVSAPEAMKTGSTGIAMNLKANGGLMFQTVTYGDPTKALGMSPKATYNQLSGSSVTITPSVQPYKLTASGATTLNSSYSFGINDGVVSTGDIAYAEIVIVLDASGSITAGMDLTLVDALTAGKTNYCVVRWDGEQAKLFVWRVE